MVPKNLHAAAVVLLLIMAPSAPVLAPIHACPWSALALVSACCLLVPIARQYQHLPVLFAGRSWASSRPNCATPAGSRGDSKGAHSARGRRGGGGGRRRQPRHVLQCNRRGPSTGSGGGGGGGATAAQKGTPIQPQGPINERRPVLMPVPFRHYSPGIP